MYALRFSGLTTEDIRQRLLTSGYLYIMVVTRSNKNEKHANQSSHGSVDLISNLPQDVLNLILTRLPIRDAVRTSKLSKTWRYKWNSIPDIVFDKDCLMEGASTMEYAYVVDQVLLHHIGSIFKFSCMIYVPRFRCIDWSGLKKLILKLENYDLYDVPSSIFFHQELCHLELSHCNLEVPPTFKGLPNLLVLNLQRFTISDNDITCLISKSPLLERLTLRAFSGLCLNIHAPNLRYLQLVGDFEYLLLGSSPLLTNVSIHPIVHNWGALEQGDTRGLIQFLGCIRGIERLSLKPFFFKLLSICDVPEKLSATYDHLKYLEVAIELDSKEVLATLSILRSSPNLKELKIKVLQKYCGRWLDLPEERAEFWGAKPQLDCLLSQLHAVEIVGLGRILDLQFIKWVLSNTPVLETMKIYTNKFVEEEVLLMITNELLQFQGAYARVEIMYLGHYREL